MPEAGFTACRDIYSTIVRFCEAGEPFAVVTLLHAEGSTPAKAGAKAIVDSAGAITGTIGGGALEVTAQRWAVEVLSQGRPKIFDFALDGPGPQAPAPICGGVVRVLVDPAPQCHRSAWALAVDAVAGRRKGVLLTIFDGKTLNVRWLDQSSAGNYREFPGPEAIASAMRQEENAYLAEAAFEQSPAREALVEPVAPRPQLLIVGGGHVGQAVAWQASAVGFDPIVIDDREEFTRLGRFPEGTRTVRGDPAAELARFAFALDTYVVLVTRGHQHDAEALLACVRQPAAYIGMIGSRRKVALMRQEFLAAGRMTAEEFDRVYAPIGLDVGAVTVPEIATSIVAQLIAVRRRGTATRIPLA